ncbi:MAG: hypothetical protein JO048_18415 [Methylobacteriaceae bacterium]|nr:hypothetical protein [Methylobacteriaceae bacterium]
MKIARWENSLTLRDGGAVRPTGKLRIDRRRELPLPAIAATRWPMPDGTLYRDTVYDRLGADAAGCRT